jgi:hypothetical protein
LGLHDFRRADARDIDNARRRAAFSTMEVIMRKHRDFENLPCFQRFA